MSLEAREICWELGQASDELIRPVSFERFEKIIEEALKKAEQRGMARMPYEAEKIAGHNFKRGLMHCREKLEKVKEAVVWARQHWIVDYDAEKSIMSEINALIRDLNVEVGVYDKMSMRV